ncbi:hypothetical protein ACFWF7_11130 [Nocardia sp. NPDC060256]|uniref:hypothetical protein n=1 Tax=unclassified Nocardia TaxID=2637762 RepID=UPI00365C739F
MPLPDDEGELEVIPFAKYQKISEAFCTKDTMTATMLADIDKVYKDALPVIFGTPDAPKDPIREARLKVLKPADLTDKAGLTNEGRKKLCENPQVRADYYQALVQLIGKAGTTPSPTMQKNELTATDMWTMRLTGFKKAFGKLLSPTDI